MKHILPILTLTTLAAAASAQAAAPAGLSYNRVGLGYNTDTKGYSLAATAVLGSSNFFVGANTSIGGANGAAASNGTDSVSLGYLFKNVAYGIDATIALGSNEVKTLGLRKDLGNNFEAAASFGRNAAHNNAWSVEAAYNVSKQIQLAVGYSDAQAASGTTDLTVRYNF